MTKAAITYNRPKVINVLARKKMKPVDLGSPSPNIMAEHEKMDQKVKIRSLFSFRGWKKKKKHIQSNKAPVVM